MSISFEGVGQVCATFWGESLTEGHVVKITENGTVGPCAAGEAFCGVVLRAAGDACAVQVGGFVTVDYSGDAPALGRVCLAADGNGGVKSAGDGVACLAAGVDTTAKTVTILL